MTARSALSRFQMTKYIAADSCPYCGEDFYLTAPSLHALVEDLPLFANASKGRFALALGQVAVTIFNLTLGNIAQS
jgi:hypothetical protein